MKQLKALLLVAVFSFSSVVIASTNPEDLIKKESAKITAKVQKLLQNPNFEIEKEFTASVTLTLNKNNEMVVLYVDSDDKRMNTFIKSRLNYKKLSESAKSVGDKFIVPVRVRPGE